MLWSIFSLVVFWILTYHNHSFRFIIKNKWLVSCNGKIRGCWWWGAKGHWNLSHEVSFSFTFPCLWVSWQNTWNCFCYLSALILQKLCLPMVLSSWSVYSFWDDLDFSFIVKWSCTEQQRWILKILFSKSGAGSLYSYSRIQHMAFFFFFSICVVSVCYFHALRYL